MKICFIDRLGSPYDGNTPRHRALGGSESAVVYIARELVKLGNEVDVYNDCEGLDAKPGVYDGVGYRPFSAMADEKLWYDVAIVSRSVHACHNSLVQNAKLKVLWMHDTFCDGDELLESSVTKGLIDEVWTLSDWHTSYISQCVHGHRRMMEVLKRKIWVTRNGVNIYRDVEIAKKDRNNFIFNAAVNKGMVTLLEDVWPKVKERIPQATLTIVGGAYPLKDADLQNNQLIELMDKHQGKLDVIFTNLIPQKAVANHLANAGYMIYPQSFPETFGISTVESLAYGTPVISGRFGAMEETAIEDGSYLMDYPVDSNVLYTFDRNIHIDHFVDLVVKAHADDYLWQQKANGALKVREVCGWDKVAKQWQQHLYKKLGLYLPKKDYIEVQRINHRTHELFNKRWSNPEEWAYYPESEKHLELIVPFYNASQYLRKCIESIASQNYENYHLWLIDDVSTDDSEDVLSDALTEFNMWKKSTVILNDERVGALANQIKTIKRIKDKDSIIVLIDGDDALANDNNIFKKINQQYHDGAQMTYGSMWSMADNIPLVAQEYPDEIHKTKSYRSFRLPWKIPYTHLRTFTMEVFNLCSDSDFRDSSGSYYKAGGDGALFYALVEQCERDRIRCIRDIIYLYNDLNPINDYKVNSPEQVKNSDEIQSRASRFVSKGFTGVKLIKDDATGKPLFPNRKTKKILIAIPTSQNIHPETFKSIYDLNIPDGFEADFQYFYGYCVDQVRNLIAHYTISNKYDYLFCVDYDMEFDKNTLENLLEDNVDIVTGLYIQRKPGEHILEIYRKNDRGYDYNIPIQDLGLELEAITGCGLGCALIKTEVLETIGYPQFTYHHAIRIEDTISEDVDFCNKALENGYNIYADTRVKCKHHGKTIFEVKND